MPKFGLGVNLSLQGLAKVEPSSRISLYSDTMDYASGTSFQYRQFWVSRASSFVSYDGSGKTSFLAGYTGTAASGVAGQLLHYFDCYKEEVPTYLGEEGGVGYGPVYGGYYGHCLYQRTALGAGGGSGGFYPDYATQKQVGDTPSADVNGWTRIRPNQRVLEQGNAVIVNFSFKLISPLNSTGYNFRFGVYKSNPATKFIASDSTGLSNSIYADYRGYINNFVLNNGNATHRIWSRTTPLNTTLMSTTSGVYTENANIAMTALSAGTTYSCSLRIVRPPFSNYLAVLSSITPEGSATNSNQYLDASPLLNHPTYGFNSPDTFSFYSSTDSCSRIELSGVSADFETKAFINKVTLSGGSKSGLNGIYTRATSDEAFSKVGGGASIYFSLGTWYLFSDGTLSTAGNTATNSSQDLVSGSWAAFAPGNSTGISATYGYNV